MRTLLALLLAGLFALPLSSFAADAGRAELFELVQQRLDVMEAVAAYKYRRELPVEAPQREQQILDAVAAQAAELGLDAATVANLFRQQMAAARIIQQAYIRAWETGSESPPEEVDLGALRKRISSINARQLDTLKALLGNQKIQQNQWPVFQKSVGHRHLDSVTLAGLFEALKSVRLSEPVPPR